MNKAQKQAFVTEIQEKLERSSVFVLMDYNGLSVEEMNALRRKIQADDVEFRVVKNTLINHALQGAGIEGFGDHLAGPTSVLMAFDDPVTPVKALTEYMKGNDKLKVKAGYFGGEVIDLEGVKQLATMPSREELLAQLLGTLQAPMRNLVGVLAAVPRDFLNVLNAYKSKLDEEAQA